MRKYLRLINIVFLVILTGLFGCNTDSGGPDSDVRVKYTGNWTGTESSGISYPVTIELDAGNSSQIVIKNFHYFGQNEKAYAIATASTLTFASQVICGNTITGSGTYVSSNKITLKYYVNSQASIDTINATYSK